MSFASMKWGIRWLEQFTQLMLGLDMLAGSMETWQA
jgi:hypothetical protein